MQRHAVGAIFRSMDVEALPAIPRSAFEHILARLVGQTVHWIAYGAVQQALRRVAIGVFVRVRLRAPTAVAGATWRGICTGIQQLARRQPLRAAVLITCRNTPARTVATVYTDTCCNT